LLLVCFAGGAQLFELFLDSHFVFLFRAAVRPGFHAGQCLLLGDCGFHPAGPNGPILQFFSKLTAPPAGRSAGSRLRWISWTPSCAERRSPVSIALMLWIVASALAGIVTSESSK